MAESLPLLVQARSLDRYTSQQGPDLPDPHYRRPFAPQDLKFLAINCQNCRFPTNYFELWLSKIKQSIIVNMHLFDLPLEIFQTIFDVYVASICYESDFKNLQLVNKLFYQEVTKAMCTTRHLHTFVNPEPFRPAYLQHVVFSLNKGGNYLACTIKHITNQLIEYDISGQKGSGFDGKNKQILSAVSHAVIDFMVAGLGYVLKGELIRKTRPPHREDLDYIDRIGEYEFDCSMRMGIGQTYDVLEHILSAAAYIGDLSLVEHLLGRDGVDLNARSNVFGPPLRYAALKGHFEIVRLLLDKGADPDGGSYPCTEEDYQILERKNGKDVLEQRFSDIVDYPDTTLEAAARNAHKEVVHLLLQPEFHISRSSFNYRKAITFAAMGGDFFILEMLIGDVDFSALSESSLQTYWDRTLRYATLCGKTETISLLLDKGAHINKVYEDEINLGFSTPLGLAAFNGYNETILFLLQKGADANGGSLHPIYMATCCGFTQTVALLLDQGAEVHPVYPRFMESAAENGEADVARVSLERGLHQVPSRFDKGECALRTAKSTGHLRVVRVLEKFGVTEYY